MYTKIETQRFSVSREVAWKFLSDPRNLAVITPPWMNFRIQSETGADSKHWEMYPGMIIRYTVSPFLRIPVTWVTEITHVVSGQYFVDEQRLGPFAFWHHQHHLIEITDGIEMRDEINYQLPFGPLGILTHGIVKERLKRIFDFRREVLALKFGEYSEGVR